MTASGSGPGLEPVERLLTVAGELDVVALQLEGTAERLAHGAFVVDDQDSHASIVATEAEGRLRGRQLLGSS